ncbi:unnamed protein product [Arctia plantaginis]|uniref:Uncharacterized protein n=1 Tax=Arctia plantaginis TaxID=874455 RepID=A0A8S1AS49_ARCPL|nr:unnamed protein product [Arctia plantaginis]
MVIPIVMLFGAAAFAAYWTAKYFNEAQDMEYKRSMVSHHTGRHHGGNFLDQFIPIFRRSNQNAFVKQEYIEFRE